MKQKGGRFEEVIGVSRVVRGAKTLKVLYFPQHRRQYPQRDVLERQTERLGEREECRHIGFTHAITHNCSSMTGWLRSTLQTSLRHPGRYTLCPSSILPSTVTHPPSTPVERRWSYWRWSHNCFLRVGGLQLPPNYARKQNSMRVGDLFIYIGEKTTLTPNEQQ